MKRNFSVRLLIGLLFIVGKTSFTVASPLDEFRENPTWKSTSAASAVGNKLQTARTSDVPDTIIHNSEDWSESSMLISKGYLGDSIVTMEYLIPGNARARLFLQGRYAIELGNNDNEWQSLSVRFRAPRFDEASNKTENALALDLRINGEVVQKNMLLPSVSSDAPVEWEGQAGSTTLLADQGPFALRNFKVRRADFSAVTLPEKSGQATNESQLVDFVALGADTFESVGCNVCHSVKDEASSKSGPTLYGLFTHTAREREIIEGGEQHRFTIKADNNYLHSSIRTPGAQLAVAESGGKIGEAYPAFMPAFSTKVLSDRDINAIGDYLATLNPPHNQGPVIKLMPAEGQQAYDPVADRLQLLVDDRTRIQRGPMPGVSGRAIHVGQANGVNYSFDPRILAIARLWQGGFLDMSGEFLNRGGRGLDLGYNSRDIELGEMQSLFVPLKADGSAVDFSFKSAEFNDSDRVRKSLYSKQDHLERLARENAQFLGYEQNSKDKQAVPVFRYRVGKNIIAMQTFIADNGETRITIRGRLEDPQEFLLNTGILQQLNVSTGRMQGDRWYLPADTTEATLTGVIRLADTAWHAPPSEFDYRRQPLRKTTADAELPAGYGVESYYPPKDNFGREQLFEALGLALAEDGTLVVATRTAGIWRLVKGEWHFFAEGTFDSLGVVIEDKKGLRMVVGQKAELSRISDTNNDGIADHYQTLFDAHSYHGNYHAYMHGPVRGSDGAYYIGLNLAHANDDSTYKGGGAYMGATGGFTGWSMRVTPTGEFEPWASGLRSPAGIALSPEGDLWYSENQGEYVSTSKIFRLKKDSFYGHPAGLVDLPGMTPDSKEIAWKNVADKREPAVILLPHNKLANSPGNPAWDTTQGKFGPFAGQMLIGDQTQSNLLRVHTEIINGIEQGSVMPFVSGLESGVMRPLFLADGSLLLGQTGRGWQAKGGHVASLQRIRWDGKTVAPAIHSLSATRNGFLLQLTQPLAANVEATQLQQALAIESWVYRDAPAYGSEEMDVTDEPIANLGISEDRKQVKIQLAQLVHSAVHPQQTARVYHLALTNEELFDAPAPAQLDAYYTLYTFDK